MRTKHVVRRYRSRRGGGLDYARCGPHSPRLCSWSRCSRPPRRRSRSREGLKLQPSPISRDPAWTRSSRRSAAARAAQARSRSGSARRTGSTSRSSTPAGASSRRRCRESGSTAGRVVIRWDGLGDDGQPLPEGEYRPRVHLREERRTIVLPNPIEIDVTPPRARVVSALASASSRRTATAARTACIVPLRARARTAGALLFVNGRRRGLTRFARTGRSARLERQGERAGLAGGDLSRAARRRRIRPGISRRGRRR